MEGNRKPLGFHLAGIVRTGEIPIICYVENSRSDVSISKLSTELNSALCNVRALREPNGARFSYGIGIFWADKYVPRLDLWMYAHVGAWSKVDWTNVYRFEGELLRSRESQFTVTSTRILELLGNEAKLLRTLGYDLAAYLDADRSHIIPEDLRAQLSSPARP